MAGAEFFAKFGFDTATMSSISQHAGVSETRLLSEFPTKTCLAEQILQQSVEELGVVAAKLDETKCVDHDGKPPVLQELINACSRLVDLLRDGDTIQAASARLTLDGGNVTPDSWNGLLYWVEYVEGILHRASQAGELLETTWSTRATAENIVTIFAGQHQYSRTVAGNVHHLGELLPTLFETIIPTIALPETRLRLQLGHGQTV